jgi:hypothetical protein
MAQITLLRYSSAKTIADLRAEIAAPKSRDWGIGTRYSGLCCGLETGDVNLVGLRYASNWASHFADERCYYHVR